MNKDELEKLFKEQVILLGKFYEGSCSKSDKLRGMRLPIIHELLVRLYRQETIDLLYGIKVE
jgi:hypothetical protein